jgi:hypothetical protein
MRFYNYTMQLLRVSDKVVSNDMSVDLVSNVYDIRASNGFSIQADYTGAPAGTLKIQISNDDPLNTITQEWIDLTGSDVTISSQGLWLYNVESAFYGWVRMYWDATSGSGVLNAKFVEKRT